MITPIQALIVEDEPRAQNVLNTLLSEHFPDVQVVGIANDVQQAAGIIHDKKPDLVFLDVELPGQSGLSLFDNTDPSQYQVIFTTAYTQYALNAFQVSAVDYLLKPLQLDQLEAAIEKVRKNLKEPGLSANDVAELKELMVEGVKKIPLPTSGGVLFVTLSDIIYLKADGSYTHFIMNNGKNILVSRKIKEFEHTLNKANRFFRPHRSYVVNVDRIVEYIKADGGSVVMDNTDEIPLSRDMRETFLQFMGMR
ncbi:MAG: LytTR family DNA-binding domain-containing protein [Bacteroidetes bacterium]|nr:LytTR family DNA-binding domain-containing protein [Bacteroidota bacterium]